MFMKKAECCQRMVLGVYLLSVAMVYLELEGCISDSGQKQISQIFSIPNKAVLPHPSTSVTCNWLITPLLPSDWLGHFVVVWWAGRFTVVCKCFCRWLTVTGVFHCPLMTQQPWAGWEPSKLPLGKRCCTSIRRQFCSIQPYLYGICSNKISIVVNKQLCRNSEPERQLLRGCWTSTTAHS